MNTDRWMKGWTEDTAQKTVLHLLVFRAFARCAFARALVGMREEYCVAALETALRAQGYISLRAQI